MGNLFSSKTPTNSIPVNKGALFSGLAAPKIAGTPAAPITPLATAKAPAPAPVPVAPTAPAAAPKIGGRRRRSTRANRKNRKQRTGKNRQRR